MPRAAAWLSVVVALVDILAVVSTPWRLRLSMALDFLPGVIVSADSFAAASAGVLLLFVAEGLARRKRRAWWLAVVLLAVSLAAHLLPAVQARPVHWWVAVPSGLLLALLVWLRSEFYAMPDERSPGRSAVLLAGTVVAGTTVGLLVLQDRVSDIGTSAAAPVRLLAVWTGFVAIPTRFDSGPTAEDDVVYFALLGIGVAIALVLLYLLLRSPVPDPAVGAEEAERVRALLDQHGARGSRSCVALHRDHSVVWSRSNKSCIAYQVVGGVLLGVGDPIGDPEAWPGAMHEFVDRARRQGRLPAVALCGEDAARVWHRETGMAAYEIGDEAIVNPIEAVQSPHLQDEVHRLEAAGYAAATFRAAELPAGERAALAALADRWRAAGSYHLPSGSRLVPGGDGLVVTASRSGRCCGVLNAVPWGAEGLSVNLLCSDPASDPAVEELLVVHLLRTAGDVGVRQVSVYVAVFRATLERAGHIGATPATRALRRVLLAIARDQVESHCRIGARFRPVWQPRFVVYDRAGGFVRVLMVSLRGEGLLTEPWRRQRHRKAWLWPTAAARKG